MAWRTGLPGEGLGLPSGVRVPLVPALTGPRWLLCKLNPPWHLPGRLSAAPWAGAVVACCRGVGPPLAFSWDPCFSYTEEATAAPAVSLGGAIKAAGAWRAPA